MVILEKVKTSEKVVRLIEGENTLCFETDRAVKKIDVKNEVEDLFDVKVDSVRTHNRKNKKFAYVKLNSEFLASDVATKLGML